MICICGLELYRHFEICSGVDSLVDLSEGSFVDLSNDLEVFPNFLQHLRHSVSLKIYYHRFFYTIKFGSKSQIIKGTELCHQSTEVDDSSMLKNHLFHFFFLVFLKFFRKLAKFNLPSINFLFDLILTCFLCNNLGCFSVQSIKN